MKTTLSIATSALIALGFSVPASSNSHETECDAALVQKIQVQDEHILIKLDDSGQGWHLIGIIGQTPGVQEKYAAALAAQAMGRPLYMRFASPYNCADDEYFDPALAVRIEAAP